MRVCSKCKKLREECEFWKRNNRKSGLNSECKECAKERRTKAYRENKEDFREKRKIYYRKNRDKLCAGQVESQKDNKRYRKYQNKRLIEKRKGNDQKFLARQIVHIALKGKMIIKPEVCTQCMSREKIEAHHEDYSKPLEILWVCYECHRAIHRRM